MALSQPLLLPALEEAVQVNPPMYNGIGFKQVGSYLQGSIGFTRQWKNRRNLEGHLLDEFDDSATE